MKVRRLVPTPVVIAATIFLLCPAGRSDAASTSPGSVTAWERLPSHFVLLRDFETNSLRAFVRDVERAGGHAAVVYPPEAAVVLAEPGMLQRPEMARWISKSTRGRFRDADLPALSNGGRRAARAWNASLDLPPPGAPETAPHLGPDAMRRPRLNSELRPAAPLDGPRARPFGAHDFDQSEYMAGAVSVGIWLLESPDAANDWTPEEEAQTIGGIQLGLTAWARRGGPPARLTFVFEARTGVMLTGDPLAGCERAHDWISEALAGAGYTGYALDACAAYNNDLRNANDTDWAFSMFVIDTPDGFGDGCGATGSVAWAYLGGPLVWMFRYSSWAAQASGYYSFVPMHEVGHTFYAADEYDEYTSQNGYLNAWEESGSACIMNASDSSLVCNGSRAQIGWRDDDEDGVIEPLDTLPPMSASLLGSNPSPAAVLDYSGTVSVGLVPNQNLSSPYTPPHAISVDRLRAVEARVDGGPWEPALPSDGAFDGYTESFTWSSAALPDGLHIVEFRAPTDFGAGADPSQRDSVWVLVNSSDRHPLVQAPAVVNGAEGTEVTFAVAAWDPDGEPLASLSADLSALPAGASFESNDDHTAGTLHWSPGYLDAGDHVVTFQVANALQNVAATTIHVANVDRAPVVLAPAAAAVLEGRPLEFDTSNSDPDGDAITQIVADLSALPAGSDATFTAGAGNASGTFHWTPTCVDAGTHSVTFRAVNAVQGNSYLMGEAQTAITVTNDCAAAITPIEDVVMSAGVTATADVFVIDQNGEEIEVSSSLPAFLSLEALSQFPGEYTGRLHFTPALGDTGDFECQLTATIAGASDIERFHLQVTPANPTSADDLAWQSAEVKATPDRVLIRWSLPDRSGELVRVDRTIDGSSWSAVGGVGEVGADGLLAIDDADVRSGARYGYRICSVSATPGICSRALWVDVPEAVPVPAAPHVERIAPNPTVGFASIRFAVPSAGRASMRVLDVRGRLVRRIREESLPRGWHTAEWSGVDRLGRNAPSGVYLLVLETDRGRSIRKLVLLR